MPEQYWKTAGMDTALSSFDDTDSRIRYILTRLLRANDFVRIEQLADELFVSRATVDRLMPDIKDRLGRYRLKIVTRPKYGIAIRGDEIKKRLCYAHEANMPSLEDQAGTTRKVQQIVLDVIQRHDLVINDINLYNLIRHCVIAIQRIAEGNRLTEAQPLHFEGSIEKEQQAAQELVTRFEAAFGVEIPQGESQYMMMHLLGKRIMKQGQVLTAETLDCIDHILEEIRRQKGLDLSGDTELYTALALHTQPLLSRLRFGFKQDNPILQDIKRDMPQAYELAVCAVNVIRRDLALDMSEDETGYLALHFAMALEKQQKGGNDWKVLVVCASGRGTAKIICHRLVERYHFQQENLILTSVFELERQDFSNILCIFTTVPLAGQYPVPAVMVDLTMSSQAMERVDNFLRSATLAHDGDTLPENLLLFPERNLSTREEVLDFLCTALTEKFPLLETEKGSFTAQVKQRETLSSTEVGNQVAMPHPYGYQGQMGAAAFLTLKKPVSWKFGTVRLVILMAIPEEDRQMNRLMDRLTQIVTDEDGARRLAKDLSWETLKACLGEGGSEG